MLCYRCGSNVADRALKCDNCGAELGSATRMMKISKGSLKALRKHRGRDKEAREGQGFEAGEVIAGRYEVRSVLGRGPFGVVYDAFDRELESEVAVKAFQPELFADKADRERFEAAVRQARRLTQQNIARLFDSGFHQEHAFVAMQRLEGLNLVKLRSLRDAEQGPYTLDELRTMLPSIVGALQHCHRSTFHGDLKPENIILQPDRLKITDFFVFDAVGPEAFGREHEGSVYVAPEVAADRNAGDSRSDLYSLGVILAELLGGEPLEGSVVLPCARNTALPRAVDEVLGRAVERDPSRRYGTIEEFSEALSRLWAPPVEASGLEALSGEVTSTDVAAMPDVEVSAEDVLEVDDEQVLALVEEAPLLVDPLDIPTAFDIGEGPLAGFAAPRSVEAEELDADDLELVEEAPPAEASPVLAQSAPLGAASSGARAALPLPAAAALVVSEVPADQVEVAPVDEPTQTTPLQDLLKTNEVPREATKPGSPAASKGKDAGKAKGKDAGKAKPKQRSSASVESALGAVAPMLGEGAAAVDAKAEGEREGQKKKKSFMKAVDPEKARAEALEQGAAAAARAAGAGLETERVRTLPRTKERGEAVRTTRNTTVLAVVGIFLIVALIIVYVVATKDANKGPQTVTNFGSKGSTAGADEPQGEVVPPTSVASLTNNASAPEVGATVGVTNEAPLAVADAGEADADVGEVDAEQVALAEVGGEDVAVEVDAVASVASVPVGSAPLMPTDSAPSVKEPAPTAEVKEPKDKAPTAAEKEELRQKAAADKAEKERLAKEKAAADKAERERLAQEKADRQKAEKERLAQEKADKAAKDKAAKEAAKGGPDQGGAVVPGKGEPQCAGGMSTIKSKDNKFQPYCIDRYEYPGGGARPQTNVSWYAAESACKSQGKRLCGIQEWQRACGAKYPWGAKWDPNKCVTEDADELERSVQAAGSMKTCRNGWGLFDMVGNVAEWVQEQRVVGGDATSGEKSASCYYATNKAAGSGSALVGFRCCADPTWQ